MKLVDAERVCQTFARDALSLAVDAYVVAAIDALRSRAGQIP